MCRSVVLVFAVFLCVCIVWQSISSCPHDPPSLPILSCSCSPTHSLPFNTNIQTTQARARAQQSGGKGIAKNGGWDQRCRTDTRYTDKLGEQTMMPPPFCQMILLQLYYYTDLFLPSFLVPSTGLAIVFFFVLVYVRDKAAKFCVSGRPASSFIYINNNPPPRLTSSHLSHIHMYIHTKHRPSIFSSGGLCFHSPFSSSLFLLLPI